MEGDARELALLMPVVRRKEWEETQLKVLRGDELEKRARELGLDIEGDPRTHSSSGRAPRAAAIIAVSRQWGQDRSTWTDSVLAGSISTVFKKKKLLQS